MRPNCSTLSPIDDDADADADADRVLRATEAGNYCFVYRTRPSNPKRPAP